MSYRMRRRVWRAGVPVALAVLAGGGVAQGMWARWLWAESLPLGVRALAVNAAGLVLLALLGWLALGAATGWRGRVAWRLQAAIAWGSIAWAAVPVAGLALLWRADWILPALGGLAVAVAWRFVLGLAAVRGLYHAPWRGQPGGCDRWLENLRVGGRIPEQRRGMLMSIAVHVLVLGVIPALMSLPGCAPEIEQTTAADEDSGKAVVLRVRAQKKPRERYVLNPNSAIIFPRSTDPADLSDALEALDHATDRDNPHTAVGHITDGDGTGTGIGGEDGAGPFGGLGAGPVGFYRLRYGGGDWDQDMDRGADHNVLAEIKRRHNRRVASAPLVVTTAQLGGYRRGAGPAFVYVTGSGAMRLTDRDCEALRYYVLEEGGMLLGDHGGGRFHLAYAEMISRVLPEASIVTVSLDDPMWAGPHPLPGGPPRAWTHSGRGPVWGVKHQGRWLALFHTGDLGDAWKDGHNGATEAMTRRAFDAGINMISLAYRQHTAHHKD